MKTYKFEQYTTTIEGTWCEISDGTSVVYSGSCDKENTPAYLFSLWFHEEYARKTNGYTCVSFDKIITVLPDNEQIYCLKYYQMEELKKYPKINASMPTGSKEKRVKQMENLGYKVIEILWEGTEKHHATKILFSVK